MKYVCEIIGFALMVIGTVFMGIGLVALFFSRYLAPDMKALDPLMDRMIDGPARIP